MGFTVEDKTFDEMLKHIKFKNMLICHVIFHCELFPFFILLAEYEILYFIDIGRCTRTASLHVIIAWMTTCQLSVERLDTSGHVSLLFKNVT